MWKGKSFRSFFFRSGIFYVLFLLYFIQLMIEVREFYFFWPKTKLYGEDTFAFSISSYISLISTFSQKLFLNRKKLYKGSIRIFIVTLFSKHRLNFILEFYFLQHQFKGQRFWSLPRINLKLRKPSKKQSLPTIWLKIQNFDILMSHNTDLSSPLKPKRKSISYIPNLTSPTKAHTQKWFPSNNFSDKNEMSCK